MSYRIPAAVAEAAQSFARAARLPVSEMSAARDVDDAVVQWRVNPRDLLASVAAAAKAERAALDERDGGLVAVIAPATLAPQLEAAVPEGVDVVSARDAKGLEYDAVVLADPAQIATVPQDLYVAMTRPTKRLVLVHDGELPAGLSDVPHRA